MLLWPSLITPWKNLQNLIVIGAMALLPQTAIAEDQRLEAALRGLDAAMKRIDALETKVGKMSSLEEENRELKRRLVKLETKQAPTKDTSQLKAASLQQPEIIQPLATAISSVTPESSAKEMWQGIYGGIYGGYGTGLVNRSTNNLINPPYVYYPYQPDVPTTTTDTFFVDGPTAGGQIGYNYVFANQVLLGAELDVGWADILDRAGYTNGFVGSLSSMGIYSYPNPYHYWNSSTFSRTGVDWHGTARAKTGYAFGNLLAYATGGIAFGGVSSSSSNFVTDNWNGPSVPFVISSIGKNYSYKDKFQIGWAAGAGFEYLLNKQWSAKAEYMYVSLGGITRDNNRYSGGVCSCGYDLMPPQPLLTYSNVSTGSFGIHQFRLGLNYHTDWLKELPVSLR